MLAELTHRCPLACPYCSNPLALESRADELDAATWARGFTRPPRLVGGRCTCPVANPRPAVISVDIVSAAHDAGLYTNLITSAIGLDRGRLDAAERARAGSCADLAAGRGFRRRGPHRRLPWRALPQAGARAIGGGTRPCAHRQCRDPPRQHRSGHCAGRTGGFTRRRAGGDCAYPVRWLGVAKPAGPDADSRAGPRGDAGVGANSPSLCQPPRHRSGGAGYCSRLPKACMGGWGASIAQRDPFRRRPAPPCRRDNPRPRVLVGRASTHSRKSGPSRRVPGLPRHRLDGGAVPVLRVPGHRFRRLPRPGAGHRGPRRRTDPACDLSPHHARMPALRNRTSPGPRSVTPIAVARCSPTPRHSSSLNAMVALRGSSRRANCQRSRSEWAVSGIAPASGTPVAISRRGSSANTVR